MRVMTDLAAVNKVRILMVGLNNSGKTTILQRLNWFPHNRFYVETVEYMNVHIAVLNLDGHTPIYPIQRQHIFRTNAVIFVVDSNDHGRLAVVRDEMHSLMALEELSGAVLLIVANKQDLENAVPETELTKLLGLSSLVNHKWVLQGCCATSGAGLVQAVEWLTRLLEK